MESENAGGDRNSIKPFTARLGNFDPPIDTVSGATIMNASDTAYATLDANAFQALSKYVPLPNGVRKANTYGQEVFFRGAASAVAKKTRVHALYADAVMTYPFWDQARTGFDLVACRLSQLIQCEPIGTEQQSMHGDSGCLLFDSEGYGLGLLVGNAVNSSTSIGPYMYFAHLEPVLALFGLKLLTFAEVSGGRALTDQP